MPAPTNDPKNPENRPMKEDLMDYFKNHSRETLSYVLLILGILLLLFEAPAYYYGGLIVGIVAGIYFGDEIIAYIKTWKTSINAQNRYADVARHLIIAGLALAFFISAPAIFLGAAISIAIKHLFLGQQPAK
jgi:hypothetical protein